MAKTRAAKVMRFSKAALIGVAAGILLIVVGLRAVENHLIFFPPRYPDGFPSQQIINQEVEDVWLLIADGVKINAFYHSAPDSKQVLFWFHGNADNIGYDLGDMHILANLGVNILEVDYRGYGRSEGSPDEAGVYRDADAAYSYLIQQRRFQSQNIIIYGHSLGGAVAINLAARRPCGGLIVESSFTNARAMAKRMFSVPAIAYIAKSRFDSLKMIRSVHAPILVVHGTMDEVIPFAMGQELYAAAPQPKRFYPIDDAGHNDILEVGAEGYLDCLKRFIAEHRPTDAMGSKSG